MVYSYMAIVYKKWSIESRIKVWVLNGIHINNCTQTINFVYVFQDKIPSRLDVAKEITKDLLDKILLLYGVINFV